MISRNSSSQKKMLVVALVSLTLLITLAVLGINKRGEEERLAKYEGKLLTAIYNFKQAKELYQINDVRARELTKQTKTIVSELKDEGVKDKRLNSLNEGLSLFSSQIFGEYHINPQVLLDLSLVKSSFSTGSISQEGNLVLVLDSENKILAKFTAQGKNMEILGGGDDIPEARLVALARGRIFVLDGQRIVEAKNGQFQTVALPEGAWGKIAAVSSYRESLYLLDSDLGQVWRYPYLQDKFGAGTLWLGESKDLSNTLSIAVDGYVWIAQSGVVRKFALGQEENFNIKGLDAQLSDIRQIVTFPESENLYILDKGSSRVVVISKDGDYKAQYLWDELKNAMAIAVSEEKNKMLVFVGSKIYEVELRQ